ncbi:hypothetical protein SCATT_22910 [Streptantibioticus cattleyicolor NRRL 8057 = DSM 46488]|uniref:Uncharacterized protein n=1 Tax=Streptantibioticus cattleyicolor (strain ATCC 35852 / DSM 46488 / JCM 4925 / NBRC 14057 / NRRL 8057) TaxID=1003195 RepID=G8WQD0_STREN|nr:hypothetical protein SCATT_22910 [Streptantibioticus cattleyicolor NRRL 8057 = DSM 46488]
MSAPLYERPGHPGSRLLGFAWNDGRRDGSARSGALFDMGAPAT